MKKLQALVLSPMDASYERVAEVIEIALKQAGVTPMLPRDMIWKSNRDVLDIMTNAIQEADIIVADVSHNSPNVFVELGFALAFRKPTMILLSTDAVGKIPSDLAGYLMATYNPDDLASLRGTISHFIKYQESRWNGKNV